MAGPAAGPFIGFGIDLKDCATSSGGSYTSVGSIVDVDAPEWKVGAVDVSYVQMAAAVKLMIAKLIEGGDVQIQADLEGSHLRARLRAASDALLLPNRHARLGGTSPAR